jgi:hypothetical protein
MKGWDKMPRIAKDRSFWMGILGAVVGCIVMQGLLAQPWAKGQSGSPESGLKSLTTQPAGGATYGKMDGPTGTPRLIPFQAYLTDSNGRPVEGQHSLTFKLYDQAESGNYLGWTETHASVPVNKGMVNVLLGSIVPFGTLTFDSPRYVSVAVDGGLEMVPRQQLIPSFWAKNADNATEAEHAATADNAANAENAASAQNALHADDALKLVTPGTLDPAVTVGSAGTVGIGTTTPTADLHVFRAGGPATLRLEGSGEAKGAWDITSSDSGGFPVLGLGGKVVVRSDGHVGIGTTSPREKLDVVNGTLRVLTSQYGNVALNQPFTVDQCDHPTAALYSIIVSSSIDSSACRYYLVMFVGTFHGAQWVEMANQVPSDPLNMPTATFSATGSGSGPWTLRVTPAGNIPSAAIWVSKIDTGYPF